jgi:hypothetical protein
MHICLISCNVFMIRAKISVLAEETKMSSKPIGILILAILQLIAALVWLVPGAMLVAVAAEAGIFGIFAAFAGLIALIVGLILLFIAYGLYSLKGWAWMWAIIANFLGILGGVLGDLTSLTNLLGIALSLIVIIYLFLPATRAAFK